MTSLSPEETSLPQNVINGWQYAANKEICRREPCLKNIIVGVEGQIKHLPEPCRSNVLKEDSFSPVLLPTE